MAKVFNMERGGFDLLRVPLVGTFLRWKHSRTAMQTVLLILSAFLIFDGFTGSQLAPKNIAGVFPWVQWRGVLVLVLLIAGNSFCMACPFMLPRKLAKKILPANRSWPRALRSKWLAVVLLLLFFWGYEAFSLWSSPLLSAWVALMYFVAAFVVDGFFKGAAFCKYVCPIGQFNFVNSLASPLEVKVRNRDVCAECRTKDCIRGHFDPSMTKLSSKQIPITPVASKPDTDRRSLEGKLVHQGCELWLFQEKKVGNMDCTFCLDCVHACPHDNVGILGRRLLMELSEDRRRSGVGFLTKRPDLAALVFVLSFGAFMNAFGMINPVYDIEAWIADAIGTTSNVLAVSIVFALGLLLVPFVLVSAASWTSRKLGDARQTLVSVATRYSYSFVPLAFGMWLAHYGYHFLTGALTFVPVTQSFFADRGFAIFGEPAWQLGPVVPASWMFPIESICLELGLLGALFVLHRITRGDKGANRKASEAAPWALLLCLLFGFGLWVMSQPMVMRGTFLGGG